MEVKNKKVLITGGAGFVGGHLVEELTKRKAKVVVVDMNKRPYAFKKDLHSDRRPEVINLDICNYKQLLVLIKKYEIEFIFHLAAQTLVDVAHKNPKQTLDNNIMSTINILEAVRTNSNIKGLIVASSDKAYGKLKVAKYIESDPLFGDHPYDVSKSVTDLLSTAYYKTYKIPVVVTRCGNIYGEGDLHFSRIIPGIMKSIITNEQLKIRSNGKYIRDYLYVKDVVRGYLLLAENIEKASGRVFNFGSGDTLTVLEVIEQVAEILNKKINYKILNSAKNEIHYQSLDYSKIRKTFDWKPKESIRSTAKKIFSWYKDAI